MVRASTYNLHSLLLSACSVALDGAATRSGGKARERKVVHASETTSTKLSWWRTGTYLKLMSCAGIPDEREQTRRARRGGEPHQQ